MYERACPSVRSSVTSFWRAVPGSRIVCRVSVHLLLLPPTGAFMSLIGAIGGVPICLLMPVIVDLLSGASR